MIAFNMFPIWVVLFAAVLIAAIIGIIVIMTRPEEDFEVRKDLPPQMEDEAVMKVAEHVWKTGNPVVAEVDEKGNIKMVEIDPENK